MARLAESSVAIALRDWQWKSGLINRKNIGMFVSLSGNADKKFGDLKVGLKDRFYLFEAKSTWDSVSEEWERPSDKGRKHAHCKLRGIIEDLAVAERKEEASHIVRTSLKAHHFLYADVHGKRPALRVEPYLMGTIRDGGFSENPEQEPGRQRSEKVNLRRGLTAFNTVHVAVKAKAKPDPLHLLFDTVESWTVAQFFGSAAALISPKFARWVHLGVTLDELDEYVQFLCDGKDEEINAIVASANGSFFVFNGSTAQLVSLVQDLQFHLKARSRPKVRRSHGVSR
ncbi:hypothetical protein [Xanthomonas albilineans]|uniref:hypothetical protein n=1 Tax=Xanthomonas albilineans TaxID=29447 RepID=UPI0005F34E6E|nr:hypothetical protein [Xanthomonas albilineans]